MTTTINTDVFVPEIFVDAVRPGFSGMRILAGSGAAILNTTMKAGRDEVGNSIKIPYFTSIGELEDVADGAALTPALAAETSESATVARAGKAFELTKVVTSQPQDPYAVRAAELIEAVARRADKALIDAAKNETSYSSYINDVSGTGDGKISYDAIVDAKMKFGDEQDDIVLMVCNSKVGGDLYKLKDSSGRPLLLPAQQAGALPTLQPLGIPVMFSDRLAAVSTVYPTLLLKRNSLVFWMNETPRVKTDEDILADTTLASVNVYFAAHRYSRMPGRSKPGVAILKTK